MPKYLKKEGDFWRNEIGIINIKHNWLRLGQRLKGVRSGDVPVLLRDSNKWWLYIKFSLTFCIVLKFNLLFKWKEWPTHCKGLSAWSVLASSKIEAQNNRTPRLPGITSTITSLIFVIHLWKRDNNRGDLAFRILNLYHVHDQVFP